MRRWSITMLHGGVRGIAALLLVLQAGAGGAVELAHAMDPTAGAATFESHHTAQCVMLHDAARCAQCQYHATRVLPAPRRRVPPAAGATTSQPNRERARHTPARPRPRTAPPRAPPQPQA